MIEYPVDIINYALLGLLILTTLGIMFTRGLLASAILLSLFSLIVALLYLVLDAPDVAITEAAVGAGISTVFFLGALLLTGEKEDAPRFKVVPFQIVLLTAVILFIAVADMPRFGDPAAPTQQHVKPYYITESHQEIGIPNTVASILASYRGYDTLGETFVIFTAGVAVLLLLGGSLPRKGGKGKKP